MIGYIALKNRGATILLQPQTVSHNFNKLNVMTDKNATALLFIERIAEHFAALDIKIFYWLTP